MTEYSDFIGMQVGLRAYEIAAVGDLSIMFIGGNLTQAKDLGEFCNSHGVLAMSISPCDCGNWGSEIRECNCLSPRNILEWDRYDMYIRIYDPEPLDIIKHIEGKPFVEPFHKLDARIKDARENERVCNITDMAMTLLKACIKSYRLAWWQVESAMRVSKTIARMAGVTEVKAAHMAEALTYLPATPK
jgi:predicted ATPase with chaperone activity